MKRFLAIFLAAALVALTGCGSGSSAPVSPASPAVPPIALTGEPAGVPAPLDAVPNAASRTFTDSVGRTVEIPAVLERVAPSGPLAQIVLFALAPDKFACLSSKWEESATSYIDTSYLQLPVVGQLYGTKGTLNLEGLAAADPQIIIDIGEAKKTVVEDMDSLQEQLGVPTVFIEATIASMGDAYRMLGELLGLTEEAKVLADYCDEIHGKTATLMQDVGERKVKLLYCLGEDGSKVIAKGSYHAEVLDLLADNVAVLDHPTSKGTGSEVDFEQMYQWKPEIVLFAPDSVYAAVGDDPRWQQIAPIVAHHYYEVPFGPYNWMGFPPSVNRYLGIIWLSELLYPAQAEYDLHAEVLRYYELFYHCTLTEEQYGSLLKNSTPQAAEGSPAK